MTSADCLLNRECPSGHCSSHENKCQERLKPGDFCASGSACPPGLGCSRGRCTYDPPQSPCLSNGDCQFSEFCANGVCQARLGRGEFCTDGQCQDGFRCVGGKCLERCLTARGYCQLYEQCTGRTVCSSNLPAANFLILLILGGVGLIIAILTAVGLYYQVTKHRWASRK